MVLQKFTAFCRSASGTGTTWIQAIEAPDENAALKQAVEECAEAWDMEPESVVCIGLAKGDIEIVYWDDQE